MQPAQISVVEPVAVNAEHTPFNASLLETYCLAFPDAQIRYVAQQEHLDAIDGWLADVVRERVRLVARPMPERHGSFWQRLPLERQRMRELLDELAAGGANADRQLLVLSAAIPSSLFALRLALLSLSRARRRAACVQAVIHGNLSEIVGWRSKDPRRRWFDLRSALAWALRARVQLLVLEDGIRDAAIEVWPRLGERLAVIEHPFPGAPDELAELETGSMPPLRIGYLGMALAVKGFDKFKAIAESCAGLDALEFHVVGPRAKDDDTDHWPMFATAPTPGWLDPADYRAGIRAQHFVCLPYDPGHYRFSASGILLDAIRFNKPVIGLRTPTLARLEQRFGDIGYLCDDIDQMHACIASLGENFDPRRYQQQRENMHAVALSRTAQSQAGRLQEALKQFDLPA